MYEFIARFSNMELGHENDEPMLKTIDIDFLGFETQPNEKEVWKMAINRAFDIVENLNDRWSFDGLELVSIS